MRTPFFQPMPARSTSDLFCALKENICQVHHETNCSLFSLRCIVQVLEDNRIELNLIYLITVDSLIPFFVTQS